MDYSPTNEYRFDDRNADPHAGLYYYMVEAENKCKANDRSGIVTNIFLEGWREEKYQDAITFSRRSIPSLYEFYTNYELFNIVHDRKYSIMSDLTISTYYAINVLADLVGVGEDINKYKVISNGMPGVNECICTSNTVSIEHEPIINFPNAFYPQDKQIENRTFYPILQFPLEQNYLFIIFNRWGQEVFRSTLPPVYGVYENPQGRWDGNFQGRICPAGIYGYKLTYSFGDGTGNHTHTGSVMLVR
jgi:hypothetical protein